MADFNGDHNLDLAVANWASGTVSILLGNGDGTFQAHVDYSVGGGYVAAVTVGDFNHDNKLDLAVTSEATELGCHFVGQRRRHVSTAGELRRGQRSALS